MVKAKFMQIVNPAPMQPAVLFTLTSYTPQELRSKFPVIQYAVEAIDIDLEIDPDFVVVDEVIYLGNFPIEKSSLVPGQIISYVPPVMPQAPRLLSKEEHKAWNKVQSILNEQSINNAE